MLEPLSRPVARVPEPADHTAAELAAASLAGDREGANTLLAKLQTEIDSERPPKRSFFDALAGRPEILEQDEGRGALLPLAIDLANAAGDDPRHYRTASRELLKRGDLNPAHRARLEQAVEDDPLRLASRRVREAYESIFAQTFNAVSAPLGRSLITGYTTAPFEIGMSVVQYLARWVERPAVGIRERQALRHWQRFLARYPNAPEAERVGERARELQRELDDMQYSRFTHGAELALERHQPQLARFHAERARLYAPSSDIQEELRATIAERTAEQDVLRTAALAAHANVPLADSDRVELLEAVWLESPQQLSSKLLRLRAREPESALSDEIEFALATAQIEQGAETASWERLNNLAHRDPAASNMARHAAAIVENPWQNPELAFHRQRVRGRERAVSTELFGNYASGPRYRAIPEELAYLIDAPFIAQRAVSTPFRMLLAPFGGGPKRDHQRGAAIAAYRYLDRFPGGEHAREHTQWLFEYEEKRGNALAALRLADAIPDFDAGERAELAERAAEQQLSGAVRSGRRDHRAQMLRGVALSFPDSLAGHDAGEIARKEAERATPQRIRLTRGFLRENPQVAGPHGLAIDPTLTDGELHNGELHPEGVTFLGARVLEVALVAQNGDEDGAPERLRTEISAARLARSVALVEEAATLGVKLDRDDSQGVDGRRDRYFERARLGLTGEADSRPTAESTYVYQGMAERYGMVRGRDSILPFDIVFQGSLSDLGLGAFPRWREPRLTPDAFLYR